MPFDLCWVLNQTCRNQHYLARAKELVEDARRSERLAGQQCRLCFYWAGRVGGARTTTTPCGLCGKELHYCNTCVDQLCKDCAQAHKLCLHCGGDIEDRNRRKL